MNEYDSSRMADLLKESHGYLQTDNEQEADLLLLKHLFHQGKSTGEGVSSAWPVEKAQAGKS